MNQTFKNVHAIAVTRMLGLVTPFSLKSIIALVLLGSTLARAASPSVATYMDCARAIGVAIHDRFVVIPGERLSTRGLYVYTDDHAVFLPLGAPHLEDGKANEFFIWTSVYGVGDIYFSFREEKSRSKSSVPSAIGYQTTPPGNNDLGNYRFTPATGSFDDGARDVLSTRLKGKVATIKEAIDNKNAFSTPEDARVAFENDRVAYRAKLERCRVEGDRGLKSVVSEEMHKLESGLPGATIWEIQIGGKQPSGNVRRNRS